MIKTNKLYQKKTTHTHLQPTPTPLWSKTFIGSCYMFENIRLYILK